jgi:hypothetical protein
MSHVPPRPLKLWTPRKTVPSTAASDDPPPRG